MNGTIRGFAILTLLFWGANSSLYAADKPKPITGTFILPDIRITDQETMDTYLEGMKAVGINTVIWNYTGVVYQGAKHAAENCSATTVVEDNFFTDNSENYLENAEKLLTSVKNKNMSIFIGLAGNASCHNWWQGDPTTPGTGSYNIINLSKRLIQSYQNLLKNKGWDGNFVKGFYISEEQALYALNWPGDDTFYIAMSQMIKSMEPNKRIMLSPYQYESTNYRTTYDSVYWLLEKTAVDIIAPQDTMGTGYVTTYDTDSTHYLAMRDAVEDINRKYPNKKAEVWANIESFRQSGNNNVKLAPTTYERLYQQMAAVDPFVTNKITWLYSWSLADDAFLRNLGAKTDFYEYNSGYADLRAALRKDYVANILMTSTPTSTIVPIGTQVGDANGDGKVDLLDFAIWKQEYLKRVNTLRADFNNDQKVDLLDFVIWKRDF